MPMIRKRSCWVREHIKKRPEILLPGLFCLKLRIFVGNCKKTTSI